MRRVLTSLPPAGRAENYSFQPVKRVEMCHVTFMMKGHFYPSRLLGARTAYSRPTFHLPLHVGN